MSKMPVVFVGHGSPMNAIEDNEYTRGWQWSASVLPAPEAILCVSAHWYTPGTFIMENPRPKMIYDMYGFPKELYAVQYPAPGAPALARELKNTLGDTAALDGSWGFDHGAWSVLSVMYPQANIPVFQVSVNAKGTPQGHYDLGRKLAPMRERGILILASGNVVHNLRLVDFDTPEGFDWAYEFDSYVHDAVASGKHRNVVEYDRAGESASLAVPTPDHYFPLLTALGAAGEDCDAAVFNEACVMGSLSMTSYLLR